MNRLAAAAGIFDDRANPIVIKELRQAVQNKLVTGLLLLFLLANVVIVTLYLVLDPDATVKESTGRELFSTLFVVLVLTSMVFVPLYAGIRLTMERNDANMDLIFITTISPAAIIRGKFWAAVALTALIYSTCMPFLTFTFLLRGIDLPTIFFSLGVAFVCTAGITMLAIFAGSVAGGWLLRMLLAAGFLCVGLVSIFTVIMFCMQTAYTGISWIYNGPGWIFLACTALFGLSLWGLFFLLSVAAVSARMSNRMLPVRLYATAVWLIFGVIMGVWSWFEQSQEPVAIWVIFSVGSISATLILTLSEREKWTPRVRRSIPSGALARLLAWPFFTGSAGGLIWCAGIGAATLLIGLYLSGHLVWATGSIVGQQSLQNCLPVMLGILLFAWCYAMTGLAIRRAVAPSTPPMLGAVLSISLLALGCIVPTLLVYLIQGPKWRIDTMPVPFLLSNPWVLYRKGADFDIAIVFLIAWGIVGLAVNLPWFRRQWQEFRRRAIKSTTTHSSLEAVSAVVVDA